jgi:hypothetical protein
MTIEKLTCLRKKLNYLSVSLYERFDKKGFEPEKMKKNLQYKSNKFKTVIDTIIGLDEEDYSKNKKLYKHYIFTSVPESAKTLASSLISIGFEPIFDKKGIKEVKHPYSFGILCGTILYDNLKYPKEKMLSIFNSKENINGEKCRILIIDTSYLEGIDLLNVKYCHILEEPLTEAILKQVTGRGTRLCGNKDLEYLKDKGWILNCFIYKDILDYSSIISKLKDKNTFNDNFKISLETLIQKNAFDYELNKNLNEYSPEVQKFSFLKKLGVVIGTGISIYGLYNKFKKN